MEQVEDDGATDRGIEPTKQVEEDEVTDREVETTKQYETETYTITAYCPCYECSEGYGTSTSTGVEAKEGVTIAVDPNVIPYGTKLIIDGKTYIAQDCGGAIKGNKIDMYFDTHEETIEWGVQSKQVTILKGE